MTYLFCMTVVSNRASYLFVHLTLWMDSYIFSTAFTILRILHGAYSSAGCHLLACYHSHPPHLLSTTVGNEYQPTSFFPFSFPSQENHRSALVRATHLDAQYASLWFHLSICEECKWWPRITVSTPFNTHSSLLPTSLSSLCSFPKRNKETVRIEKSAGLNRIHEFLGYVGSPNCCAKTHNTYYTVCQTTFYALWR